MTDKEKEIKRIKRLIRNGTMPRRIFAKEQTFSDRLQRVSTPKIKRNNSGRLVLRDKRLSWKTLDTLTELTKELKNETIKS